MVTPVFVRHRFNPTAQAQLALSTMVRFTLWSTRKLSKPPSHAPKLEEPTFGLIGRDGLHHEACGAQGRRHLLCPLTHHNLQERLC